MSDGEPLPKKVDPQPPEEDAVDAICPVCGGPLVSEKCKVVCRSERCRYRIVFNCAEF
jgi:hypothetical protein